MCITKLIRISEIFMQGEPIITHIKTQYDNQILHKSIELRESSQVELIRGNEVDFNSTLNGTGTERNITLQLSI